MVMKLLLLVTVFQTAASSVDTDLIKKPKLDTESPRVVWYQIPNSVTPNKFELRCQASGDSVKYEWLKNGREYPVDNVRVVWQRSGQSNTLVFVKPKIVDQGFYQWKAFNDFGVALSNVSEVKLGTLDHFPNRPIRELRVKQGQSLTLPCASPYGFPRPTVFWLYRNTKQSFVIETIDRPHIMVDGDGSLQFAFVEMHDGRENLVYQCAATSPVLHGEYRAGDEVYLTVENSTLIPTPPEPMWFSPKVVNVTAGETLKLICIFSGYPAPIIIWSKKFSQLPKDRLTYENFGRTLIIRPTLHTDLGLYSCQAGKAEYEITVGVSSAPQWVDGPPKDLDASEEDDIEINCRANGDPKPEVRWYKNGIPIEMLDEADGRTTVSEDEKRLKIILLQQKVDRAIYQCNASNPLGYVFANVYVNVRAHSPRINTAANQTVKAVIGSTVDLDCSVDAAPKAKIRWLDIENNEIVPIERKREILTNGNLRIRNLRSHDEDIYFCTVINKFGFNQARRTLNVYKPSFFLIILEPDEKIVNSGDEIDMKCKAESDNRLKIEYIWYKDGRVIQRNACSMKPSQLKLSRLRGYDSGVYKCTAKTDVDEISTTMKLFVKDVPDAPIITGIQCLDTQAVISWTIPSDNNDRILEYFVEYNTSYHPEKWRRASVLKSQIDQQVYEVILNLSPWVAYTFRVHAVNSLGQGLPGYMEQVTCRTRPSPPDENPFNVTIFGTKKGNLVIQWQPLDEEAWNAPNMTYLVRYRSAHLIDDDWHELRISDPIQNEVEVNGLPTYKKYCAQVISTNALGTAIEEPETYCGYSGEDGKVIKIWETNTLRKRLAGFLWEVGVGPDSTNVCVDGFLPMHHYAANVIVSNTKYNSSPSEVIRFRTPEGPPGPVENLTARAFGAQTVITTWSPPKHTNGNLTVYRIQYLEENEDTTDGNTYEAAILPGTKYHMHDALKPSTNYTVIVWAVTGGGQGSRSVCRAETFEKEAILTFNTDEPRIYSFDKKFAPGRPDFEIQSLNYKSVIIKWLPSQDSLPGTAFHVNYSRSDTLSENATYDWLRSYSVHLPDIYLTISNLTTEVEYLFVLYASDGDFSTPSLVKHFRIIPRTSLQYSSFLQEKISGAIWLIAIISALCAFVLTTVTVCACKLNKGEKYPVKKKELERGQHNVDNDEEKSFIEYQYGPSSNGSTSGSVDS